MDKYFLKAYDWLVNRKAVLWIGIIVLLGLAGLGISTIKFEEDISRMIPIDQEHLELSRVLEKTGIASRSIILISGSEQGQEEQLQHIVDKVDSATSVLVPSHLSSVRAKIDQEELLLTYEFILKNLPMFLEEEDYNMLEDKLDSTAIYNTISESYNILISPAGMIYRDAILQDPLGISLIALEKLKGIQLNDRIELVDGYFLSKDHQHAFIYLNSSTSSSETGQNRELVGKIDSLTAHLNQSYPDFEVSYFGAPAIAVTNADTIKSDIHSTVLIALLILSIMMFGYFRNVANLTYLFVPVIVGSALAMAIIALSLETVSAISIGIGSVLLGISLDFSIHILTHLTHEPSKRQAIKEIIGPVLISSLTTCSAFTCLLFVKSDALSVLGLFASLSVAISSVFALIFLPVVIKSKANRSKKQPESKLLFRLANAPLSKQKYWVIACTLFTIFGLTQYRKASFEYDMSKMNFMTSDQREMEAKINELTGNLAQAHYMITGASNKEKLVSQLMWNERWLDSLQTTSEVDKFTRLTSLLIPSKVASGRIEKWNDFWSNGRADQTYRTVAAAGQQYGFTADAFEGFRTNLMRDYAVVEPDSLMQVFSRLLEPFLYEQEDSDYIVDIVLPANDKSEVIKLGKPPHGELINTSSLVTSMIGLLKNDFDQLVTWSTIAVFLILLLYFRRIELALLTFLPIVITWIWTLSLMHLLDIKFTIFNLIISTFIFGLGIDYGIFITKGLLAKGATGSRVLSSYRTSVLLSVITTLVGIGVLAFADHPSLRSIALLCCIGMVCVFVVSFTIQPLIYDLFVGRRQEKGKVGFTLITFLQSMTAFLCFGLGCLSLQLLVLICRVTPVKKVKKQKFMRTLVCQHCKFILRFSPNGGRNLINRHGETFQKPAVLVANHHSFLDILLLASITPNMVLMTNDWVYKSPIFGTVLQYAGYLLASDGIETMSEQVKHIVDQNICIGVFPEGTRSRTRKIGRFKKGAFYLAKEFELDIIPIALQGTSFAMTKGDDQLLKRASISTMVMKRIPFEDHREETYRETTKRVSTLIKKEYELRSREVETPAYYRKYIRDEYCLKPRYINRRFHTLWSRNASAYHAVCQFIDSSKRTLIMDQDMGISSIVLGLVRPDLEITSVQHAKEDYEIANATGIKPGNVSFQNDRDTITPEDYQVIVLSNSLIEEHWPLINSLISGTSFSGEIIIYGPEDELRKVKLDGFSLVSSGESVLLCQSIE